MQIKIFLWKLLNSFLPICDNLQRIQIILQHSRCRPLCRNNFETTDHVFFGCCYAKKIWRYFMNGFELKMPSNASIRQIMILWWIEAGSKTVGDIFEHNMPDIITWHIWKVTFTQHMFGVWVLPLIQNT
ncbi:unnamed protein product [Cuscuta epithymum]|uniref:Reverse transcriptase zinc-binding domain-containing protein n=1 Tax=Cuscuta epithymum TaxID=186058 RepID=A0AAV0FJT7_9ASTE|nr:unnamed protein product [Cuscuta epithymum]